MRYFSIPSIVPGSSEQHHFVEVKPDKWLEVYRKPPTAAVVREALATNPDFQQAVTIATRHFQLHDLLPEVLETLPE